jgi:uncharacterized protein YciI
MTFGLQSTGLRGRFPTGILTSPTVRATLAYSNSSWSITMYRCPQLNRAPRGLLIQGLFGVILLGIVGLLCWIRPPSAAAETTAATAKTTFLVIYRPGPAWAPGKPIKEQPPKEHGKYLLDLFAKGSMKFAGPFMDNAGGAVVLEAANETEATALVKSDPAVQKGIFLYELHPWELVPWQKYLKK